MTLSSETVRVQYSGDGSTVAFPTTFEFWVDSDVKVILTENGVDTEWTDGTQYDITGHISGTQGTGTVTVKTTPTDYTPASGTTLTVKSDIPLTQLTDLTLGGSFPSTDVEQQLNKNVRQIQQIEEEVERAVKLPESSSTTDVEIPEPDAGKVLRWNTAETGFENATLTAGDDVTLPISVSDGGTGATTVAGAVTALELDGIVNGRAILANGDFQVWQRGVSFTGGAGSKQYTADRWAVYRGVANFTTTRTGAIGEWTCRVQRDSGTSDVNSIAFGQALRSEDSRRLWNKQVTLSFLVAAGANYSPASSTLTSKIHSGTATDESFENMIAHTWTGHAVDTQANTITTSSVRYTHTMTIPSGATQIGVEFNWTPVGTAGAADNVDFLYVQLEEGTADTPLEHRPYILEYLRCQEYFQSSFPVGVYPGEGAAFGGTVQGKGNSTNVLEPSAYVRLTVPMRATPTVTLYNPRAAGTDGEWDDNSSSSAASRAVQTCNQGFNLDNTGNTLGAGSQWFIHWAAEAEL